MKMTRARILVLAVALASGAGAIWFFNKLQPPEVVVQAPPPSVPTDGVLVAKNDLYRGDILSENAVQWVDWPAEKIPEGVIRRSASPGAIEELRDSKLRANLAANEPLRRERVATGPHSGFIASDLPPGKRAAAINIDAQGSSTAGGFILPDDTVDVIHIFKEVHFMQIFRDEPLTQKVADNALISQTILTNVRVLAIGQNVQVKNGERVVTGSNATLEVTPAQAETLLLAQRTGTLTLTLRSISDANTAGEEKKHLAGDLKIGRGGGAKQIGVR